jgi:O-succinylbenzoate synthase
MEKLLGHEWTAPDVLNRPAMDCGSAAFALDAAILGCMGAEAGLPLRLVLVDAAPEFVAVNALLDGEPDAVLAAAREAVAAGYTSLKIKVGRQEPGEEARLVQRVREAIGEHIHLRLDANRAWTLPEAHAFVDLLADTRIEYIEEPLLDPRGVRGLTVPVALDESLAMPGWEELGAVAAVLKPSLRDGIAGTLRSANTAREHGLKPVVSSLFESGVGLRTLAALAAAIGEPGTAHGLDTLRWFAEDAATPTPAIAGGRMATDRDFTLMLNPRTIAREP